MMLLQLGAVAAVPGVYQLTLDQVAQVVVPANYPDPVPLVQTLVQAQQGRVFQAEQVI
jgi:hypothetical protein